MASASTYGSFVHDAVVEVIISLGNITASTFAGRFDNVIAKHSFAKMIITVWEVFHVDIHKHRFKSEFSTRRTRPDQESCWGQQASFIEIYRVVKLALQRILYQFGTQFKSRRE